MNQVMIDIWPYLLPPILLVIGWLFRQIFALKSELDVANKTIDGLKTDLKSKIEGLEEKMQNTIENLEKIIDSIQKRQDSHSKKQDDILEKMNSMEKKFIEQVGGVRSDVQGLASDIKGLSNLILISDPGVKVNRQQ